MPQDPTPLQREASAQNGARSTGPTTVAGKARSSTNALRHGLRAIRLLLPDESARAYRRHLDEWVDALRPECSLEGTLVAAIADLSWRLRRLSALEHRRVVAHLDQKLKEEPDMVAAMAKKEVLVVMTAMIRLMKDLQPPFPPGTTDVLVSGATEIHKTLSRMNVPMKKLVAFEQAIKAVRESYAELDEATYEALRRRTQAIASELRREVNAFEARIESVRAQLAAEAALLPEKDAKVLERCRKTLEQSLQRELDILDTVRTRSRAARASSGSFGEVSSGVRVQLRVVK